MAKNSIIVANGILALSEPDKGDLISNLKIQKLLYYCQGFHLALYNEPFFEEEIEAWQYGPVVPVVYTEFNKHGSNAIPVPEGFNFSEHFNENQISLLQDVFEVYGQFSALKLMQMTHEELPWKQTPYKQVISNSIMKDYFQSLVIKDAER